MTRSMALRLAALLASLFVATLGCSAESPAPAEGDEEVAGSLLAVGDTGEPWGTLPWLFEGQMAVGAAMQREHAARPVDAVVLLGDNFYPSGLRAPELLPRIVENVARPYCSFIVPSPALVEALAGACPVVGADPPPLFAVIGNHDLRSEESADLQRHEVPRFVRNWEVPRAAPAPGRAGVDESEGREAPALRELPGGLSLIFLLSEWPWDEAQSRSLAAVLRQAKGPWRIIIGHRPPITGHPGLSKMIARASREADVRVHAYLAGHVHALGAIRGEGFAPALTVIAGSGAVAEKQTSPEYAIENADWLSEELGFARVDSLVGDGARRLRITLFAARSSAALAFLGHPVAARYEIGLDTRVER